MEYEENLETNKIIDHQIYHTGNDLDMDGYYCTEDEYLDSDFVGDNDDYKNMSINVPKVVEWKNKNMGFQVAFNDASEDIHKQLSHEIQHVQGKIKAAYQNTSSPLKI